MAVILKYPLKIAIPLRQVVHLPIEAQVLSVEVQNDRLCLWALCEDTAPDRLRLLRLW